MTHDERKRIVKEALESDGYGAVDALYAVGGGLLLAQTLVAAFPTLTISWGEEHATAWLEANWLHPKIEVVHVRLFNTGAMPWFENGRAVTKQTWEPQWYCSFAGTNEPAIRIFGRAQLVAYTQTRLDELAA